MVIEGDISGFFALKLQFLKSGEWFIRCASPIGIMLIPTKWFRIDLIQEPRRVLPVFPRSRSLRNHPWAYINQISQEEYGLQLSEQVGVYIMWFEFRGWAKPIYVGQTAASFRQEVFTDRNRTIYRDSLEQFNRAEFQNGGCYYLSFLYIENPRRRNGQLTARVTNEITACEDAFIAKGIAVNPQIMNSRNNGHHGYCIDQIPSTGYTGDRNSSIVGDAKALAEGFDMPWVISSTGTRVLIDLDKWPHGHYRPNRNVLQRMRDDYRRYDEQ